MRVRLGDGTRLFVDIEGLGLVPDGPGMRSKPTLLLLHGGEVDHSWFKPRFSLLADVAQIVYLDHRGFGRSDRGSSTQWTLAQWGDDVRELCEVLGIDHPVVLGSSLGGCIAMSYACRHPDHPAKLILASTTARDHLPHLFDAYERLGGSEARSVAERFLPERDPSVHDDWIRVCYPLNAKYSWTTEELARLQGCEEVMAHWARVDQGRDQRADLALVRCPTLVIAGADDPLAPVAGAAEIVRSIPDGLAKFELVEGAGHGVCRDRPDVFFPLVRAFLQE